MTVKGQATQFTILEYDYSPAEYVVVGGEEYQKKGTGQASPIRVVTFKRRGNEVPDELSDTLLPEHVKEVEDEVRKAAAALRQQGYAARLRALLPALHEASDALSVMESDEEAPAPTAIFSDEEAARLHELLGRAKRLISSAGLGAPERDAKKEAGAWLDAHPPLPPTESFTDAGDQELTVYDDGLAVYHKKHGIRKDGGDTGREDAPPCPTSSAVSASPGSTQ